MEILSLVGGTLDPESVAKRLRIADQGLLRRLIDAAQVVIAPAAVFRACYVDEKRNDRVVVDGVVFTSWVLRRNLNGLGRVFPLC